MQPIIQRNTLEIILFFFLSLFLFTVGLSTQEVIGFDSRFYLFAQEMWQQGLSWFPTTYYEPYPDYLSTSTVLIYFSALSFGGLTKLTAVLPSAMAASITVVFTYLLGALQSKRLGIYAALFLLLTLAFIKSARSIALDMYPTLLTVWCFYLVYSADINPPSRRAYWIYPLLILSFAFRGPIGLVIPTGVVCVYYLLTQQFRKFWIVGGVAFGLLVLCTFLLLALAYHVGGQVFLHDVLRMQVLGRIDNNYLPIYFYFVDGVRNYALAFPIAIFSLIGILAYFKRLPERSFLLLLIGWVGIILMGMSLPGDKKTRYILPMVPAIALLAAYPFAQLTTIKIKYFSYLRAIFLTIFLYFPAIFLLAMEALFFYARNKNTHFNLDYTTLGLIFSALQLLNFAVILRYLNQFILQSTWVLCMAVISLMLFYLAVVEPIDLQINRARDLVHVMEAARTKEQAALVFYRERPDGLPIKYLMNMPQFLPKQNKPIFLFDEKALSAFTQPAFFITSATYFMNLPPKLRESFRIIASDTLGHVPVVIFKRKPAHD